MILSFKHKGVRDLFQKGNAAKINPDHVRKVRQILFLLNNATSVEDCNFPGSGLHKLKGELENFWAVKVNGNWRIIFRFDEGQVFDVDYVDYH